MGGIIAAGPANSRRLALLLGWTGGSMRHLRKHESMWHKLGVRTVAATNSFDMTFLPEQATNIRAVASELMECVCAQRREHPSSIVVPHVFSNGGALLMLTMLNEAKLRALPLQFDGAVFDSAPTSRISPIAAPLVIAASGLPLASRLWLLARIMPYALVAQLAAPAVGVARPMGAFDELRDPQTNAPRPELFVFSDGDMLIRPTRGPIGFAAHRAAVGAQVESLHLEKSAHVAHYRMYPEEYSEAVRRLLERLEPCDGTPVPSADAAADQAGPRSRL